ncbi:GNAT family N-acetyltransferase [Cognaticolwellia mytili]|uniref:GNAT family N-acetyltransferase n=1 Tax=Cognaticolwellia mytili TaxID=1888913 RepID=UPI000A178692|nr:GNAT family N-acetyltransferase [Cognaticolwellia mytili]
MCTTKNWQAKKFIQLTTDELYDLLKLRIDIFVVEQSCFYPDLDDHDRHSETLHLFCYQCGQMTAYLRILPKGSTYRDHISIGRVAISSHARGTGLGHKLMKEALMVSNKYFAQDTIKISAQEHLEKFYNQHGFERVSNMYLEDGIPHIGMLNTD